MNGSDPNQNSVSATGVCLPPDERIFGRSPAMQLVRQKVEKAINTDVPILIQGPGGTGKELLARWIHERSRWRSGQIVKVNCAAIPGPLLESELFGYEKGAFTGATTSRPGRVEMAKFGSLFFDEVAELDLALQAKLLHLLQDGRFSRLGDLQERLLAARIICATSRDLVKEASAGHFRPDLFYRINVIHVEMPPLRDRREDIPFLVEHFLSQFALRFERVVAPISTYTMHYLQQRQWLGNIRELENCVARYVVLESEEAFRDGNQEDRRRQTVTKKAESAAVPLKGVARQAIRELERNLILKALQENRWNRRKAAQALNISYRALIYKIREAGLPRKTVRNGEGGVELPKPESSPDREVNPETQAVRSGPPRR